MILIISYLAQLQYALIYCVHIYFTLLCKIYEHSLEKNTIKMNKKVVFNYLNFIQFYSKIAYFIGN